MVCGCCFSSQVLSTHKLSNTPLHTSSRPSTLAAMISFTNILLPLVALAFTSQTAAIPLEQRDIFSPPVLYPHAGTVWTHGQTHNITWYVPILFPLPHSRESIGGLTSVVRSFACDRDTSNPPQNITDRTGLILLWQGGRPTTREYRGAPIPWSVAYLLLMSD